MRDSIGRDLTYRDASRTFGDVGLWDNRTATLTDRDASVQVRVLGVTDGTFQALGVQPTR